MTTKNKAPGTITQKTGTRYRHFDNLEAIKNTNSGSYAISATPVNKKNETHNTPSTLTFTNFKFNLPSDAVAKKVTVHYRHAKRGVCNGDPCSTAKHVCNIPAPTINIVNVNGGKGQAPAMTGSHQTFTVKGRFAASIINDLTVKVEYPANTNKYEGFVLFGYLYVTVDYARPSYALVEASANNGNVYNGDDYHLKVKVSDSNKTLKRPSVVITAPTGMTFKEAKGANVTKNSARVVTWNPLMQAGSNSVELIYETNITYSGGAETWTGQFNASISATGTTTNYTATVYKTKPASIDPSGQTEEETSTESGPEADPIITIKTDKKWLNVKLNLTEEEIGYLPYSDSHYNLKYLFLSNPGFQTAITTPYEDYESTATKKGTFSATTKDSFRNNKLDIPTNKIPDVGDYNLLIYCTKNSTVHNLRNMKVNVRPKSLSTPYRAFIKLGEEELHRLGDGYEYTAQSDVKLVTDEYYVRDWFKCFKIGVFNNQIDTNLTTYYQYDNTGTSFDGDFLIPASYDLSDKFVTLTSDKTIDLTIGETTYNLVADTPITLTNLTEYDLPTVFTRNGEDNVIITMDLCETIESEDVTFYSMPYHINFNASADEDLHEVTIDTTDYDNLTDHQIHTKAKYWSTEQPGLNEYNSVECPFIYDKNYPVYIIITGDYPEGDPQDNDIVFTEPCIVESDDYTNRVPNGQYPVEINDLIKNDGSTSELTLGAFNASDKIIFYDYPLEEGYGTNEQTAVMGIELTGNVEQTDQLVLYAQLHSPTGESHSRSVLLNDYDVTIDSDNNFTIGGNGDLWGFNTLDIKDFEDWETELIISNATGETDANINFGDVYLILHTETVETQNITCKIEGENISYYGAFIQTVKIPEGLNTDTAYLKVDGTDTNDAYRQNITEKVIELEVDIGDNCNLEEATESLRQFTKLLVNDRDEYNRPIPKRIEFSHYPDVYWEYVMEDAFDTKIQISSYSIKAKLTIPAGTSYDKEPTSTGNTGYINGIAAVNPIIIVKPTDTNIEIVETQSNQKFNIAFDDWTDKILEIDCEDRIAWLRTNEDDTDPVNLNKYIDFNSDWFTLKGEYSFSGTNCIIRSITFSERW